jgi:D-alanyl-D-alanine carboxypeptidase
MHSALISERIRARHVELVPAVPEQRLAQAVVPARAGSRRLWPCLLAVVATLAACAGLAPDARADNYQAQLDPGTRTKLGRALRSAAAGTKAPGVIAGVWVGDRGWTAVRGTTRRGAKDRPTLRGHTRIGSVTKTFTGTLILQLVDEGKLRLDDTIERWFPQLPDARTITIRELGSMSSGINSYTASPAFTNRYLTRPTTVWTPTELISAGVGASRLFAPGDGYYYSNTNFVMLGHIVERVTGEPIARVMKKRIFDPLKMRETSYPSTTRLPAPYWRGYTDQNVTGTAVRDATHWSPTAEGAAGQIVSTLADMRRYTRALGTGSLLRPATQRARLQPNLASQAGGRAYLFALGIDHGWLSHTGEVPGFNTQVAYLPRKKATIVVLTNTDIPNPNGGSPAPAILSALAKVVSPRNVPAG